MAQNPGSKQEIVPAKASPLPPARTNMTVEDALEVAGVDRAEFGLLATTTFKEARSLEELATLIATTRRRGLDGLLKQVYFEKFGGDTSGPSLHVGIDGLRTIAAHTGRMSGQLPPKFSGVFDMQIDERDPTITKPVPAECEVVVFATNERGVRGAYSGMAYMEESYPGPGARGRMWRQRPKSMLAIAAERQALRKACPAEMSGIADIDDIDDSGEPAPPTPPKPRPQPTAADYDRIYGPEEAPPKPPNARQQRHVAELRQAYAQVLEDARSAGVLQPNENWKLPEDADEATIVGMGKQLRMRLDAKAQQQPPVKQGDDLADALADTVARAAAAGVEYADQHVALPAPRQQVETAIATLEDRIRQGQPEQLPI